MAVESASLIQQLNELWPLGTDPKSEGDNHIRLIKSVLKVAKFVPKGVTVFLNSGSWTNPGWAKSVIVICIGGGGAGGKGDSAFSEGGGGGGSGAMAISVANTTGVGSVNVTVGLGGNADIPGPNGGDGASTSFGSFCVAAGGKGGGRTYPGVGGAAVDCVGTLRFDGHPGSPAVYFSTSQRIGGKGGGAGGGSSDSAQGRVNSGGGGAGGAMFAGSGVVLGGNGGSGRCIVLEYEQ